MGQRHFHSACEHGKITKELLAQTLTPQDAYEYAIRREKGIKHSRTMEINPFGGQTTAKQEPVHYINTRCRYIYSNNQNSQRSRGGFRGRPYPRGTQNTRGQQRNKNVNSSKQGSRCGIQYNQKHLQSCQAIDKICSNCAKRGHFANACIYFEKRQDQQQKKLKTESLETENDPVVFAEFTSNNGWDEYQRAKFSVMAIADSFEIKKTKILSEDDLNGHIVKLKTNSEEFFAIPESGSPMSFLIEKTARRIQQNDKSALIKFIPPDDTARNLACYNLETLKSNKRLITIIESGGWRIQSAPFIIVDDQKTNTLGHNIPPKVGVKLIQEKPNKMC